MKKILKTVLVDEDVFEELCSYPDHRVKFVGEYPSKWIPVSERSPEGSGNVLVTDGEDVFIGWKLDGKWYSNSHDYYEFSHPIIAWMPLPEPYEPHESEEV